MCVCAEACDVFIRMKINGLLYNERARAQTMFHSFYVTHNIYLLQISISAAAAVPSKELDRMAQQLLIPRRKRRRRRNGTRRKKTESNEMEN